MSRLPDPTEDINKYYKITNKVLGQGYFAVVKVGKDLKTGEEVAVKFVKKSLVEREETLANEIDILGSINHPNVVGLRAIFDTEETLFIVMDLMKGGELYEEIVKRKTFSEKDASKIMAQLFSALAYLHNKGIVHRDLKLENLLLVKDSDPDLHIKLADFGLSKLYSGKALQTACGTPFYVAPDILMGDGYGTGVDMWASGVLLYVLLSGRLPFAADTDTELFKLIMVGDLIWKSPQFDTVSAEAKDLISKLIVVEPEQRLSAKQALDHPFIANKGASGSAPLHSTLFSELQNVKALSNQKVAEAKEKKKQ